MTETQLSVPEISCDHCKSSIEGVTHVDFKAGALVTDKKRIVIRVKIGVGHAFNQDGQARQRLLCHVADAEVESLCSELIYSVYKPIEVVSIIRGIEVSRRVIIDQCVRRRSSRLG